MRAYVPAYDIVQPADLFEAFQLLASGNWLPFAGGTDLMVVLGAGKLPPANFLDISGLPELGGIRVQESEIRLGALTSYGQIAGHPLLQAEFPNLVEAARATGAVAIQNRGTLGGNIANASPAADSPPALLAYQADIELVSARGSRRLAYANFHTGYKQTQRQTDELISAVVLPRHSYQRHYYRKVGTRKAQAISKVCLAATDHNGQIRLGFGSVAPTVVGCPRTSGWLSALERKVWSQEQRQQLQAYLADEIAPIDDLRSNRDYRFQVAVNLVDDFWCQLCQV